MNDARTERGLPETVATAVARFGLDEADPATLEAIPYRGPRY